MTQEEKIVEDLKSRFNFLEGKIRNPRAKRIFLDLDLGQFKELFDYAIKQMGFSSLCAITGLDEGVNMACIYHLSGANGITLNIKVTFLKENPVIQSVTNYFSSAEIYERELVDLFGIKVQGLAEGNRYPLTDDWPKDEFPLRKDWKGGGSSA